MSDDADLHEAAAADDAGGASGGRAVYAALFAAIAVLIGSDVLADLRAGAGPLHVGLEGVVLLLALTGVGFLWVQMLAARRRARALRTRLSQARADAGRWRSEAQGLLRGLGEAIDRQFGAWSLSPAEREVGLLLLKGLALQEIARTRGTSERTARQQALAIYRKAGLAGRAELSAFFLEDLLLPPGAPL